MQGWRSRLRRLGQVVDFDYPWDHGLQVTKTRLKQEETTQDEVDDRILSEVSDFVLV